MTKPTIKDFLTTKVEYDSIGSDLVLKHKGMEWQTIGEVSGFGFIQNLFKDVDGVVDFDKADAFQDELGEFIAAAINEKIERDFK